MAETWDDVVRIYVVGRVMVEGPDDIVEASGLPGRQGRLALVYLAAENRILRAQIKGRLKLFA